MPISVPVANLEHSRMCPTTSTTSAMRMRTTNALAFRQCLALSCFLPIRSPSWLRTFFHPNTISAVAFTSSIRSFVVRRVTETGTLSTAGENYLPEGMPAPGFYAPVERGLEIKIAQKLRELRVRNVSADFEDGSDEKS